MILGAPNATKTRLQSSAAKVLAAKCDMENNSPRSTLGREAGGGGGTEPCALKHLAYRGLEVCMEDPGKGQVHEGRWAPEVPQRLGENHHPNMVASAHCACASCTVWALVSEPGFLKFQIFRFSILEIIFLEIFSKIMLERYRGINNKGILERPWTIWGALEAISTTLKCQFTRKCRKVDFLTSCTTKSAENLHVGPYGRCGHPGNP